MQKRINIGYTVKMDDGDFIEGNAIVELWTGEVKDIKIPKEYFDEKIADGYVVENEAVSFKAGNTTVVLDCIYSKDNEKLKIENEKRLEMIGWVKAFPESFTSPDKTINSTLGAENRSEETNAEEITPVSPNF